MVNGKRRAVIIVGAVFLVCLGGFSYLRTATSQSKKSVTDCGGGLQVTLQRVGSMLNVEVLNRSSKTLWFKAPFPNGSLWMRVDGLRVRSVWDGIRALDDPGKQLKPGTFMKFSYSVSELKQDYGMVFPASRDVTFRYSPTPRKATVQYTAAELRDRIFIL